MPERDIRTRLKLEGEQQFKSAMKAASDSIKVLNSEQKLAEAQFKATGDKEQYLADKTDILQRKIEEQQKAVNAAQEAVNKLREKGVDPNNKAMQEWTTKLNNAKTYLTRLQGDLASTESELSQQGQAFADAAEDADAYNEQLADIGQGVDFSNTINSLSAVQGKLQGALDAVTNLGTKLVQAELDAAQWADDLNTAAAKAGIDEETYQSWEYAAQLIDTDIGTIIGAQSRLLKSMSSDSTQTMEIFNRLGVVTRNQDGTLRDYNATFWDTIDALGQGTDAHGNLLSETERDEIAQELFGKSYRELLPLINAGSDAFNSLAEEGRQYATVSGENVDKLNALNDAHDRLTARMDYLRLTVLASMADGFTAATTKASGLVDAFNEFLQTDEGQQALANLGDAIEGLLDALMPTDFEGLINGAAEAVRTLTEVLKWIADHGWTVVAVLGGMKAAVAGIEVTKTFLQMLQLVKSIQWLNVGKGAKGLADAVGGGAAATGGATGGAAAGGGLAGKVGSAVSKGGKWLAGAAGAAAPWLALAAAAGVGSYAIDKTATERQYGDYNRAIEQYDQLVRETTDTRVAAMQRLLEAYATAAEQETDAESVEAIKETFRNTANEVLKEFPELDFWKYLGDSVDTSDGLSEDEIERILGLGNLAGDVWYDMGTQVVAGLADGIRQSAEAADASAAMAQGVQDAVTGALAINSPSKVMFDDGAFVAQGLADGINARAAVAIAAAQQLAAAVQAALAGAEMSGYSLSMGRAIYAAPSYGGSRSGSTPYQGMINNTVNIDGRQLANYISPMISQNIAAQARATGPR